MNQIERGQNERAPAENGVPEQPGYKLESFAEPSPGAGLAGKRKLRVFDAVIAQVVRSSKCNNRESAKEAQLRPGESKQPDSFISFIVHLQNNPNSRGPG